MEWLRLITKSWLSLLESAAKHKRREFQGDADEIMRFFDGPYDFLYSNSGDAGSLFTDSDTGTTAPRPTFQMTYNKVAEAVQLFGPTLYHRNPHRQVNPTKLPPMPVNDPNNQQLMQLAQQVQQATMQQSGRAEILAWLLSPYLNYTPNELNLRGHSRDAIDEALIKGVGLLWTQTYSPVGSDTTFVGSFYDTVDNLLIDPDMESIENAKWIARRRVLPTWEVEERYGLERNTLNGDIESISRQSRSTVSGDYIDKHRRNETNDLTVYYEVYSRMGIGHKLKDSNNDHGALGVLDSVLDKFGEHTFLAVTEGYPFPLNLPEKVVKGKSKKEAFLRAQWPTPFWADPSHPWPFTEIAFHRRPRKVWPMSHFKPALGELKFLNWAFSFIADKIKNTSRDFIAIQKSAGETMKSSILSGKDLTLLEIESLNGRTIHDVVSFLQHPNFNADVYQVIDVMMNLLDKRLGLNELMYGESKRQLRSASEAQIKGDNMRIRPDDMAECVEAAMTMVARKEALCCRWHLQPEDVAPMLGQERAALWGQVVQNAEIHSVVYELDYRIEAGSIRKPNRNRDQENANSAVQVWGPVLQTYYQATGDPAPLNAIISKWALANDEEPQNYLLKPPPPPQPQPPDPTEQLKIQGEQQKQQMAMQSMQMKAQIEQQKAQMEQQKAQMDAESQMVEMQAKLQAEGQKTQQELFQDAQEHDQEIGQDQEFHLLDMLQKRQEHQLDMEMQRDKGDLQLELARRMPKPQGNSNGQRPTT